MTETPEANRAAVNAERQGAHMSAPEALAWFLREILPLEAMLMQYLRQNWRDQSDIEDLVQEVYVRVFEAARKEIPEKAKPFLFTTARNLLINRVRDRRVVPMEAALDLKRLRLPSIHHRPIRALWRATSFAACARRSTAFPRAFARSLL